MPVGTAAVLASTAAATGGALLKKAAASSLAKRAAQAAVGSAAAAAGGAAAKGLIGRMTGDDNESSSDVLTQAGDLAEKEWKKSERRRKLGNVAKVAALGPIGLAAAKIKTGPPRYGSLEIAN